MRDILHVCQIENLIVLKSLIPLSEEKIFSFLKMVKRALKLKGKWEGIISSGDGKTFILYDETQNPALVKGVILKAIANAIDAKVSVRRYLSKCSKPSKSTFGERLLLLLEAYSHIEPVLIKRYGKSYLPLKEALVKEGFITENFNPLVQASAIENFILRYTGQKQKRFRICPICLGEVLLSGMASGKKKYHKQCKPLATKLEKRKQRKMTKDVASFIEEFRSRLRKPSVDEAIRTAKEKFRNREEELSLASYCLLLEYSNRFLKEDDFGKMKTELVKLHSLAKNFINP